MNNKPKITIGIPAYNEEANIKNLLLAILAQKQENFDLKEIIVVSDGSTDHTVDKIRSLKDGRIKLYAYKTRKGQQIRQNKIIGLFREDILVLLEADTLPVNGFFLRNLVKPMITNKKHKIGITFGNAIPLKPKSFFENIMYFKSALKKKVFLKNASKSLIEVSGHRGRAFSKDLVKKIIWVNDAPEDTYSVLLCRRLGYDIVYSYKAKIYHRLPGNYEDYYRQYTKFIRGKQALLKYFPENEITKLSNYRFPRSALVNESIKATIKNPLIMFLYIFTLLTVYLRNIRIVNFDPLLDTYMSTKKLRGGN